MAVALLEMTPESLRLSPSLGPILIMAEATVPFTCSSTPSSPTFTTAKRPITTNSCRKFHTGYSVLAGLGVHALFDGVAIGSGFAVNNALGWLIFLAVFLHKAPEGFTMASVMLASGQSRTTAFYSAVALAGATMAGVLVIELVPAWTQVGLPISAGVALYVGASDLVPEVNREPGIRMALVFFAGVAGFLLLRMLSARALKRPNLIPASATRQPEPHPAAAPQFHSTRRAPTPAPAPA